MNSGRFGKFQWNFTVRKTTWNVVTRGTEGVSIFGHLRSIKIKWVVLNCSTRRADSREYSFLTRSISNKTCLFDLERINNSPTTWFPDPSGTFQTQWAIFESMIHWKLMAYQCEINGSVLADELTVERITICRVWCNSNCTLTNNRPLIIETIYIFGTWFRTKNTDFLLVNRPIILDTDRSLWEISKLLRSNFEISGTNFPIFLINKSRQKVWLWPNPCRKCESLPDWWFCLITIWIIQVWIGFPKSFRIGISIHPFGSSTVFS